MGLTPKAGSLERLVLDRMLAKPEGVTYLDFSDVGLSDEQLGDVVRNLQNGMFEAEGDYLLKPDD